MTTRVSFRFMSWNLNWAASKAQRAAQLELIRDVGPDLLCVQEVKATTLRTIEPDFSWAVFALGPNPDDRWWTTRMGTAVLGGARTRLLAQMAIAPTWFGLPHDLRWKNNRFSRRAMWARVTVDESPRPFLVGSLHASPAAGDIGEHKPWFHAGVGRWLGQQEDPWIFGIDANAPGSDAIDPSAITWGWPRSGDRPGEDELLGSIAPHRGRDLLRDWLDRHPEELRSLRTERPDGPLAVSYHLPTGPVRYDHCWATPELEVQRIEYLQDSFDHSDHAAIVADLTVTPPATRSNHTQEDSSL